MKLIAMHDSGSVKAGDEITYEQAHELCIAYRIELAEPTPDIEDGPARKPAKTSSHSRR